MAGAAAVELEKPVVERSGREPVNRQCAPSLSAIAVGAAQIAAGMGQRFLAGEMESCSTATRLPKRKTGGGLREAMAIEVA
ncbi:hypothetical protein H0P51_09665 [Mycobacterium vicinigordonae]|uniref:Uncharacterized protein n=1 Tax=Mycobacterium vicinigordonae TaxID=1719132 RepID=A0A7D6IAY9_9MYCO|nr:hypothetical protein H0P51_09665 [Mycobacterium vicinigordonae]